MPFFLTLLILIIPFSATAEIYTWTDAKGVTHFSQEKPVDQEAKNVVVEEQKAATQPAAQATSSTMTIPQPNTMPDPAQEMAPTQAAPTEQMSNQTPQMEGGEDNQPAQSYIDEMPAADNVNIDVQNPTRRYINETDATHEATDDELADSQINHIREEAQKPMGQYIKDNETNERPE